MKYNNKLNKEAVQCWLKVERVHGLKTDFGWGTCILKSHYISFLEKIKSNVFSNYGIQLSKKKFTITNLAAFEICSNTVIFLFIKAVWLKVQTLEPD